jgi:hypothetical protein
MLANASKPSGTVSIFRLLSKKLRGFREFISGTIGWRESESRDCETECLWIEAYKAALLEFNEERLSVTCESAMRAIEERKRVLRSARRNIQEWKLLEHAALTLCAIKARRGSAMAEHLLQRPDLRKNPDGQKKVA